MIFGGNTFRAFTKMLPALPDGDESRNLIKSFQVATTAGRRPKTRKRRTHYELEAIQTLRYKWINRAGLLVHPDGYATLDVGDADEVKKRFAEIDVGLRKAA